MANFTGKGISAFSLKMIMAALMVMDHLAYFLPDIFPFWFRYIGRMVAPVFCYLMTVSLRHTRDRGKYIIRLATAGLVMFAGNLILMYTLRGPNIFNNIFLSLAVGAALIVSVEQVAQRKENRPLHIIAIAVLCAVSFFVEGSLLLPVMALIFYFLRGNKPVMFLAYLLAGTSVVLVAGMRDYQLLQAFAIIPIALYSGKKGGGAAFSKWFFYLFYPLHIWILYIVQQVIFI